MYLFTVCGITRGKVVEGRYIPSQERWQHPNLVAAAHTTSPRSPHQVDRCRCVSHLIKRGLEKGGGERAGGKKPRERERDCVYALVCVLAHVYVGFCSYLA